MIRLTLAGADTLKRLDAWERSSARPFWSTVRPTERRELRRLLTGVVERHRSLLRAGVAVLAPDSVAFEDRRHSGFGTGVHDGDDLQHFNEMA